VRRRTGCEQRFAQPCELHAQDRLPDRASCPAPILHANAAMTIPAWARSMFDGWQMPRTDSRILRSSLPVAPKLSRDEVDASVVNFRLLARTSGLSAADVAIAVRDLRAAHARRVAANAQRAARQILQS